MPKVVIMYVIEAVLSVEGVLVKIKNPRKMQGFFKLII
mgnify:CR=1 FL=1